MSDPLKDFNFRLPVEIKKNPKVKNKSHRDVPPDIDNKNLPTWLKWIIAVNMVTTLLLLFLTGFEFIPFMLNDAVLVAYIMTAMGLPIGLGNKTIQKLLSGLFLTKS